MSFPELIICQSNYILPTWHIFYHFSRYGTFGSMVAYGCERQITEHSKLTATMCIGLPVGVLLKIK